MLGTGPYPFLSNIIKCQEDWKYMVLPLTLWLKNAVPGHLSRGSLACSKLYSDIEIE